MKRVPLLFLFLLAALFVSAGNVSEQKAYSIAVEFAKSHNMSLKAQQPKMAAKRARSTTTQDAAFYIFNMGGSKDGFVIVSGDDRMEPVFGYSTNSSYDATNVPDGLKWMLDTYSKCVEYLNGSTTKRTAAQTRASYTAIEPLIQTQWSQYWPYNLQCPQNSNGDYPATGCVATAMAQILYYYDNNYPNKWTISSTAIPSYTFNGTTYEALEATTFDWSSMKTTYSWDDSDENAQAAVAKLMKYCGYAAEMQYGYGDDGSAAVTPFKQFYKYFGFSKKVKKAYRDNYTTAEEWNELIYNELNESRPVLYSGQSSTSGHQFICDGYDGKGYFHINWGWNGWCDGYYLLSDLTPSEQGAENGYNSSQDIVYNLIQKTNDEDADKTLTIKSITSSTTSSTRSNADSNFDGISITTSTVYNGIIEDNTFPIQYIGLGLYDSNDNLIKLISKDTQYSDDSKLSADFSGVADGTYKIKAVSKASDADSYIVCDGSDLHYIEVTISNNTITLNSVNPVEEEGTYTISDVSFSGGTGTNGNLRRDDEVTVDFIITNSGTVSDPELTLKIGDNSYTKKVYSEPNGTSNASLQCAVNDAGEVALSISKGETTLYSTTITVEEGPEANLSGEIGFDNWEKDDNGLILPLTLVITNEGSTDYKSNIKIKYYGVKNGTNQQEHNIITTGYEITSGNTSSYSYNFSGFDSECEKYYLSVFFYSKGKEVELIGSTELSTGSDISTNLLFSFKYDNGMRTTPYSSMTIGIYNSFNKAYDGPISWDITRDGVQVANPDTINVTIGAYSSYSLSIEPTYESTDDGNYQVNIYYKKRDSDNELTAKISGVRKFTVEKLNLAISSLSVNNSDGQNVYEDAITGNIGIKNTGDTSFQGKIEIRPIDFTNYDDSRCLEKEVKIPSNESVSIPFDFQGLTVGSEYYLSVEVEDGRSVDNPDYLNLWYKIQAGVKIYKSDGTYTATAPTETVTMTSDMTSIDLTQVESTVTSINTENANPNALYIFASSDATALAALKEAGKNVIVNNVSEKLTLTDGNDFYSPVEFTAAEATFSRTPSIVADGTKGWQTLCLPFEASSITVDGVKKEWFTSDSDSGKDLWLKTFSGSSGNTVEFSYNTSSTIAANTPYIIAVPGSKWGEKWDLTGKTLVFEGSNVTISATGSSNTTTGYGDYNFVGKMANSNVLGYILNDDGTSFVLNNTGTGQVNPFTAYFTANTVSGIGIANSLNISSGGTTGIETPVVIDAEGENAPTYNLSGQRVSKSYKGIVIKNGKKIIRK